MNSVSPTDRFARAIDSQINGRRTVDPFAIPKRYFGAKFFAIPTHEYAGPVKKYTPVFQNVRDMPADVVKGILGAGRAFMSFRYVMVNPDQDADRKVRVGTICQRYVDNESVIEEASNRWTGSSDEVNDDPLFTEPRLGENEFLILNRMLEAAPLNETGGRYLLMYENEFPIKNG